MNYTPEEIIEYVEEEDVKFIRLAFIDLKGNREKCFHHAKRTASCL